jgi:hypothetical protein
MATSIDPNPISWRQLHQLALDETDPAKLLEHVHAVEGAVFSRWMELSHSANHHEEPSRLTNLQVGSTRSRIGSCSETRRWTCLG